MREGLRSGKLLLNPRRDGKGKVSRRNVAQNETEGCSELRGDDNLHLISNSVKAEKESLVVAINKKRKEECVEDGECVTLVNNGGKRRSVCVGEENESDCVVKKKVKEEESLDCKVQIGGQVLRSRFMVKSVGDEEDDKVESEGCFVGNGTRTDSCEKKKVKVEKEEIDQQVGGSKKLKKKCGRTPKVEKEESDQEVSGLKKRLKKKRGRPSKVEKEESDQEVGGLKKRLKKKRGRPSKVEREENDLRVGRLKMNLRSKRGRPLGRPPKARKEGGDQLVGRSNKKLKHGCGRPPKLEENNALDKEGKGSGSRKGGKGLRLRDSVKRNVSTTSSYLEKRLIGKELNLKRFSPGNKNKCAKDLENEDDGRSLRLKSKMVITSSVNKEASKGGKTTLPDEEVEPGRSVAKQLVRERITELLFTAGWTVEYRPRGGRAYNDAVYVSPDGKTHWSVTLAYRVLKQRYEAGDGESKTYKAGFVFSPIPEEDFSMLKRVVSGKKEGKTQKKKNYKYGDKTRFIGKKKPKGKSAGAKLLKGRMKGKSVLQQQDNSAGTSKEVVPSSVRGHMRRKTQNKKQCALLVRNTMEGVDSDGDGYILYDGKRTVFAWMMDLGTMPLNGKVHYLNQRRTCVRLEGWITRDGIHCDCCKEVIPISKFEAHAGSDLCQPFRNIFLESGTSLLQCLLDSWNKQEESECKGFHFVDVDGEDPNDDTCAICGDGGDLICCDGCPSTFHQSCIDVKKFPAGDWHCLYCSCKFCGMAVGSTYERRDSDNIAISALLTCHLCEQKFHKSCILANDAVYVDSSSPSFCGKKCQELFERLQMLLGVKHELEEGFSWTVIRRSDLGSNISPSEIPPEVEWNSKLAVAFFIMDECFVPFIDHRSGVNLIHNILYNCGSNFTRLNYSAFLTVILERGDEIISAASVRIHGNELAEMPFIGTRHTYRRQGMCRRLLSSIESALCSLNVEKLVIPAISELRGTWTSVFGFKPLDPSSKQKMRTMNMLVFPGVDMLQKPLLNHQFAEDNMISEQGLMPTELALPHNSDSRYRDVLDLNVSRKATAAQIDDINQLAAIELGLRLPDGFLDGTTDVTSGTISLPKCIAHMESKVRFAHDNLEENITVVKPLDSVCNANGPTGEVRAYQIAASGSLVPTLDDKMDLDSKLHYHCSSEEDSKLVMLPHVRSEASDCGKSFISAFGMDTENVDCEMKMEDGFIEHTIISCNETTIHHSTENIFTQPHGVACLDGLKVVVKELRNYGSPQLQDMRGVLESNERTLDTQEGMNSHAACQFTSTAPKEVCPATIEHSGSQVQLKSGSISCDVARPTLAAACMYHQTSTSVYQKDQTITKGFPDESNTTPLCQVNWLDTFDSDVSAAVEGRCCFSCEASLNPTMKSSKHSEYGSQVEFINLTKCECKSSEHSESELLISNASITQCNSESVCNLSAASNVALHCASGGGNSCGTPDVIVLSNQAS